MNRIRGFLVVGQVELQICAWEFYNFQLGKWKWMSCCEGMGTPSWVAGVKRQPSSAASTFSSMP